MRKASAPSISARWAVREFDTYLRAKRWRDPQLRGALPSRETIASSPDESAVNQVISKRMVKKQQMRWSPRDAHLLLQVRTRVLNNDSPPTSTAGTPASSTS
jgi:hypothetical protein